MGEKRTKSRILFSSESLVGSVFKQSENCLQDGKGGARKLERKNSSLVRLRVGVLRCERMGKSQAASKTPLLMICVGWGIGTGFEEIVSDIRIADGTQVLVKNVGTNVGRIG